MVDLLILPGRGSGPLYASTDDPADIWAWLEPPPDPVPKGGIPYRHLASLGDARALSPFLYTVELDVAEADLPAVFDWYEKEHLSLLTACPGCLGGSRFQRLDGGSPNLLAAYRFERRDVNQTPEWEAARNTEWTLRIRPLFRNSRRYMRKLLR